MRRRIKVDLHVNKGGSRPKPSSPKPDIIPPSQKAKNSKDEKIDELQKEIVKLNDALREVYFFASNNHKDPEAYLDIAKGALEI